MLSEIWIRLWPKQGSFLRRLMPRVSRVSSSRVMRFNQEGMNSASTTCFHMSHRKRGEWAKCLYITRVFRPWPEITSSFAILSLTRFHMLPPSQHWGTSPKSARHGELLPLICKGIDKDKLRSPDAQATQS